MKVSEVRKRFLAFYKERGHVIIPSAPIVPGNDPTTLFTSSGMQPLLPYFLGKDHPEGKRVVNSQLSFRAGDIEEVGDNRHTTFFEMLGNWSFGDYFKEEQLPWIFEFLTSEETGFGIDPKNLYVTVFAGDKDTGMAGDAEAAWIWAALFGSKGIEANFVDIGSEAAGYEKGMKPGDRIFAYDAKKNWWSRSGVPGNMPAGEPGGPDSEIFYDFGTPHDPKWGEHCHPNCDCGRFVEIGNSVFMQFVKNENSTFSELPKKNIDFGGGLERIAMATVGPDIFLLDVFDAARQVIEERSGKKYGQDEETTRAFRIVLDHMRATTFMLAEGVIPSKSEAGYVLRRLLRRTVMASRSIGVGEAILPDVARTYAESYQDGYPHLLAKFDQIQEEIQKENAQFGSTLAMAIRKLWKLFYDSTIEEKDKISGGVLYNFFTTEGFPPDLTLDQYRAYRKAKELEPLNLKETETLMESFNQLMKEHQDTSRAGGAQRFAGGLADHAEQTVRYHTTHHILLKALQSVLGAEVHQRGSNITAERLRIDFSSPGKMTDEQKTEVEKIVNEVIYQDLPVTRTVMPREEAEKLGAEMEFGVKYPDMVSVYSVGPLHATEDAPDIPNAFSLEFCGGPHVSNTSEIHEGGKHFKIQKEEAVASGIRRIKAVLQ